MSSLATPAQLGAFLQTPIENNDATALLMLDIASGMVRDFLQLNLSPVANEVVLLDPIEGSFVLLPELPISSVSKVEIFDGTSWTELTTNQYTVSRRIGMIAGAPGVGIDFPTKPETWRVTYSHGYTEMPSTIVGVTLALAARFYTAPDGITSESIGGYSVSYATAGEGFTKLEQTALARYKNPRIA